MATAPPAQARCPTGCRWTGYSTCSHLSRAPSVERPADRPAPVAPAVDQRRHCWAPCRRHGFSLLLAPRQCRRPMPGSACAHGFPGERRGRSSSRSRRARRSRKRSINSRQAAGDASSAAPGFATARGNASATAARAARSSQFQPADLSACGDAETRAVAASSIPASG